MTTLVRLAPRSFATVCEELDHRSRMALGFERIRALLEKLENPHEELKTVQVVGTNGKGTTAVALAGALEAAGVRSSAYLSPHVLSYTERIMLGGNRVSEQGFASPLRPLASAIGGRLSAKKPTADGYPTFIMTVLNSVKVSIG